MRGKGNCTYRQQNHLPLMIVHPDYPGGKTCQAVTSQIDLTPTLLALTGAEPAALRQAGGASRDAASRACWAAGQGCTRAVRPAALYNYNMLSFQDARWARKMEVYMRNTKTPMTEKLRS